MIDPRDYVPGIFFMTITSGRFLHSKYTYKPQINNDLYSSVAIPSAWSELCVCPWLRFSFSCSGKVKYKDD